MIPYSYTTICSYLTTEFSEIFSQRTQSDIAYFDLRELSVFRDHRDLRLRGGAKLRSLNSKRLSVTSVALSPATSLQKLCALCKKISVASVVKNSHKALSSNRHATPSVTSVALSSAISIKKLCALREKISVASVVKNNPPFKTLFLKYEMNKGFLTAEFSEFFRRDHKGYSKNVITENLTLGKDHGVHFFKNTRSVISNAKLLSSLCLGQLCEILVPSVVKNSHKALSSNRHATPFVTSVALSPAISIKKLCALCEKISVASVVKNNPPFKTLFLKYEMNKGFLTAEFSESFRRDHKGYSKNVITENLTLGKDHGVHFLKNTRSVISNAKLLSSLCLGQLCEILVPSVVKNSHKALSSNRHATPFVTSVALSPAISIKKLCALCEKISVASVVKNNPPFKTLFLKYEMNKGFLTAEFSEFFRRDHKGYSKNVITENLTLGKDHGVHFLKNTRSVISNAKLLSSLCLGQLCEILVPSVVKNSHKALSSNRHATPFVTSVALSSAISIKRLCALCEKIFVASVVKNNPPFKTLFYEN